MAVNQHTKARTLLKFTERITEELKDTPNTKYTVSQKKLCHSVFWLTV